MKRVMMQTKTKVALGLSALIMMVVLLGSVTGAGAQAGAAHGSETVFLTFVPNVQFAPIYVTDANGYFDAAGFDVTIEHGDEPVGVDLIATGQRNFGMISGEQVLAARAQGRPVVMVFQWFHEFPVALVYNPDRGIAEPSDLIGRTIGVPGRFGASYSGLVAFLSANGIAESDVQIEEIGFNAPEVYCTGRIDSSAVYINNEPLQIANRIAAGDCGEVTNVGVFPVADAANLVSNGIVTSEALIANDPERVAAFVGAYAAGLRDTISNPAQAYLISADFVETLTLSDEYRMALTAVSAEQAAFLSENPDVEASVLAERRAAMMDTLAAQFDENTLLQLRVLMATIALWEAERLGEMVAADWQMTLDTLVGMGVITAETHALTAFTDAFLPPVE